MKYEDGPFITLRSKKARVVNSWNYDLVLRNGLDVTGGSPGFSVDYSKSSIGFDDNGRFSVIEHYADTLVAPVQYDGSWSFQDDKSQIALNYDNGTIRTWTIARLCEVSFWVEEDISGNIIQYQLKPSR